MEICKGVQLTGLLDYLRHMLPFRDARICTSAEFGSAHLK